ncbi:MAG TPA: BatD family protein [Steroidobacteraceae bacterium]|nr:BatD family protein [Steroidobacteraceae bacterium]
MQATTHFRAVARRAILIAWLAWGAGPVGAATRFTVTLDPPNFDVNDSAELTITATGDEDAVPIIPRVPGLVINPEGQSSSIQQVNGAVRAIFARTYRVTASHEGTFVIPPIQVGSATTASVTVHVGAAGSGSSARRGAGAGADKPAVDLAAATRAATPMMKVVVPASRLYVGELIPIQIKAYFREGVSARLEGPLAAVGDAFTVSGLDKRPTQTQETVGGMDYTVLTWNSVLGALKSGAYPIGLEMPVTLNIQLPVTDSDIDARLRSLFGTNSRGAFMDDPAFGNLFGRVIQKTITLKPTGTPVTVLPLPVEGRPADFAGAVGQFQVAAALTPAAGVVGDPLTFKFTVTGKGNLARVSSEALHDSTQWRAYRSESKVTADDDTGLQGFKTFSQPVIPLQAGQLTLPGVSFSYFDPEAARYVTRATQPIRVTVTPGSGAAQVASTLQGGRTMPGAAPAAGADALAADATVTREHFATLEPVIWRPWFAGSALAPVLLMLAAITLIRRHQQRRGDPALMLHAARLAAIKINIESMGAALKRGDGPAFFTAARHALQERLADLWQVPAESVDQQLVAARVPGADGVQLQAIFAMAEKATYAGESPGAAALQEWQRRVLSQLDRLEAVT